MAAPTKARANLYIERDVWERTKAALAAMPGGGSASALVEELLTEYLPILEAIAAASKSGDMSAGRRAVAEKITDTILRGLGGGSSEADGT